MHIAEYMITDILVPMMLGINCALVYKTWGLEALSICGLITALYCTRRLFFHDNSDTYKT